MDYNSKQFLIKNSYAPDLIIDGGEYTKPTTASVTTSTVSTTSSAAAKTSGSGLPQTGQLWWPVLPMGIGGLMFVGLGISMKPRKKND